MTSPILRTTVRLVAPLMLLFSLFLLLRGHNEPGGGFAGALVAAGTVALYAIAYGGDAARRVLRVDPRSMVAAGLLVALASGVAPVLAGRSFLTGLWARVPVPGFGVVDVGTPLLFDVGVYLVVLGTTALILLTLDAEEA